MEHVKRLIIEVCENIVKNSVSDIKIAEIKKKHENKIHFMPIEYRVFGGILHSMNIQWGNFLEKVIEKCIELDSDNELLQLYSGKKTKQILFVG